MTETAMVVRAAEDSALAAYAPDAVIEQATAEANTLARVIEHGKLYSNIQGRKYVRCEGWTTLATLRGFMPREVGIEEYPDGRYVAIVELIRLRDGAVMTRASAECGGPEEALWQGRPPYARRSMAITRATAKACRIAFSWVMALAGYEATPAEEMEGTEPSRAERARPATVTVRSGPAESNASGGRGFHDDDGGPWIGKLVKREVRSGKTGDRPWTLHTYVAADGERFGTFDTKVDELIVANDGKELAIVWEPSSKGGKNIVEVRPRG